MDPMSALAAASSVLQIVDFASRLILKSNEYRASTDGLLTEHREHAAASQRLRDLADELAKRPISTGRNASSAQIALKKVTEECAVTANEFIMALNNLKPSDRSHAWTSFRQAFKTIWSKEKVLEMSKRLSSLREQVLIHLVVIIRSVQLSPLKPLLIKVFQVKSSQRTSKH